MKLSIVIILVILMFLSVNLATADIGSIECITDKHEYSLDESVQITITNNTNSNIQIANRSEIDGGFASVQFMQADQSWKTIPLVTAANITTFENLKPKESITYRWHISRIGPEKALVVPGIYRIVLNIGVRTNEFRIK